MMTVNIWATPIEACRRFLSDWKTEKAKQALEALGKQHRLPDKQTKRLSSILPAYPNCDAQDRHWAYCAASLVAGRELLAESRQGHEPILLQADRWGLDDENARLLKEVLQGRSPFGEFEPADIESGIVMGFLEEGEGLALADALYDTGAVDRIDDEVTKDLVLSHVLHGLEMPLREGQAYCFEMWDE